MRIAAVLGAALLVSGCAYQMQMMPRDSGKIYSGRIQSNGAGSGSLAIDIDGRSCSGSFARAASGDSFGFFQSYGRRGNAVGSYQTYGGSSTYKALLSCSDGTGMRCDVEGAQTGGGICVDSTNRVLDMIYTGG